MVTTAPLDLDAVRAAVARLRITHGEYGVGYDVHQDSIRALVSAAPALLARIEALEAGLLEACDLAETVCAEVTAYTDRGNPRIIDDDEARGEIARLRALAGGGTMVEQRKDER